MDGAYGFHSTEDYSYNSLTISPQNLILPPVSDVFGSDEILSAASVLSSEVAIPRLKDDVSFRDIKAKIASHPSYPRLLQAYIDCQKVGAPAEIACLLDEILRENYVFNGDAPSSCFGTDPDLDNFMETYCDILVKYKLDLARPFDEATTFLNKIEMQLRNLCTGGASVGGFSDDNAASSGEELSGEETEAQETRPRTEDRDLKDRLLQRFGSRISTLKLEFSKKNKTGKLPREARQTLLKWWDAHYNWPYPTEADKIALAETTGLDQRQVNNWFINQRKRHWKPTENMPFGMMDDPRGRFFTND